MEMVDFKYQKLISITLTLAIILALVFSGPASAVVVRLSIPSGSEILDEGETVVFTASIDIENLERLPVRNLTISIIDLINYSNIINCTFGINGTKLTPCENLTITADNNFTITYGELFGYDNGSLYSFGYGPGLTGLLGNQGELSYEVRWDTPPVDQNTDYSVEFFAHIGNGTHFHDYMMQSSQIITVRDTKVPLEDNTIIEEDNTKILVPQGNSESKIEVPQGKENISLDLNDNKIINGSIIETRINGSINISVNTSSGGKIDLFLPENLKIMSSLSDSWDGSLLLPSLKSSSDITIVADAGYTASASKVVEVGFPDIKLVFDRPVRILLKGEAGKDAGYSRLNVFYKISRQCIEDSFSWADSSLAIEGDCKMDLGSDLVIWTKHFTLFTSYTQTSSGSGSPSNGGSSSSSVSIRSCSADWDCESWSSCRPDGVQTRKCEDLNECLSVSPPSMMRHCVYTGTEEDDYWKLLGWEEEASASKQTEKEADNEKEKVVYNRDPSLTGFSILESKAQPKDNIIFFGALILFLIVLIAIFISFLPKKK